MTRLSGILAGCLSLAFLLTGSQVIAQDGQKTAVWVMTYSGGGS